MACAIRLIYMDYVLDGIRQLLKRGRQEGRHQRQRGQRLGLARKPLKQELKARYIRLQATENRLALRPKLRGQLH